MRLYSRAAVTTQEAGMANRKQKTHKGIKKRVKVTATGKVKFHKHNKGHLQSHKSGNRRRRLRGTTTITGPYADKMIILLGPGAR
jgi:large subunit ribosomal protein L35